MEGDGGYNRSSQVQAAVLSPAVSTIESAGEYFFTAGDPNPCNSRLRFLARPQLSAAAGRGRCHLRGRIGSTRAISVVHTDLPENDFSGLFQTSNTDRNSYLQHDRAVFASAVGRSFYEQVLPSESVTLGWSSWAV